MIKCEKCNAVFSNEKIYNIHKILCSNKSDNKKENEEKLEEKTEDINKEKIEEKKIKRTTSRKKKSGEDD